MFEFSGSVVKFTFLSIVIMGTLETDSISDLAAANGMTLGKIYG